MGAIFDLIFSGNRERDILFKTAISSANQIQNLFKLYKEGEFPIDHNQTSFTKIYPEDAKSPAIFWIDDNQFIVRYPEYSTPYNHSLKEKCKFVECLSGVLYDKNSNRKLFAGDSIKIKPNDTFVPYTEDQVCYLRVCLNDCNKKLESICK